MPVQILSTKLSIPPLRSRLVVRPRLIQKLNQGMESGFVLVSAPAGYGKTTLLSAWLDQVDCITAWLSLDDGDNDPARFLAYLAAALRQVDPSIGEAMESKVGLYTQPEAESLLTPLINQIAQVKHPFCLILDDYHVIQNQEVHQIVSFMLEHRPPALHLVIATRADPPLPLARLRARSGMLELRLADLRFTMQEAADFLNSTMGLKISPDDVGRITRRTEGWIAGLQMAALSMQHTEDVSGFITAFTGSHHYIVDYLLGEILGRQSPEIRRFLLYTSILDLLTGPLCDALLEGEEETTPTRPASVILEELEHANLFILPLDHEQRWYRYHPLFAELLRGHLQKNNPSQIAILQTRASDWFEGQGLISDAIRHALASSNWECVVRLISANIFALLEQSALNAVARQLENLTSEDRSARPWLCIGRAWLAAYTGQLSYVEPILKLAEAEIGGLNSQADLETLGGHIATIRAYTSWIGHKREIAVRAAQVALEWLPETERLMRCQAATILGLSLHDSNMRTQVYKLALGYAREISVSHVTIFTYGCWAWELAMEGRLREAHTTCQEAMQLAQSSSSHQPLPTLSHVYSSLSFVLCEWNDIEGAIRYGREAVDLARRWEQADALHFALNNLGYALFASGDVEGAFDTLRQSWQVAHRTSAWFEEISIAQEVEWYLAQENLEAALQSLRINQVNIDEASRSLPHPFKSLIMPLISVQVFIAQKQYTKALTLIANFMEDLEEMGVGNYLVRLYTWQALAYHGLRQEEQSIASLRQALTLAAPEGYVRTFIGSGPALIYLLHQARDAGVMTDYVDKLLAAVQQGVKAKPIEAGVKSSLIEPLSEREMDVMKLLMQGCTDKKIAETLVIARETVHKHLKNIYAKLDVHSRSEAIVRARELGML
jgi:ATP/maltotriose-dependent transcriptional regulator MalT